jgi:Ca-activated chloride channel family protein
MLNATVKSHRPYLRADAGVQKLFVMLKMSPAAEAATSRPRVDLALVLDTSGSMRERAPGLEAAAEETPPAGLVDRLINLVRPGSSKLDVATEAARRLLQSAQLHAEDTVSIIQFDDSSTVLATGHATADRTQLLEAVNRLQQFSGGTQMALGLQNAVRELTDAADATRTVFLLTDGQTVDEEACRQVAVELAQLRARIIALGVGEQYNEDLLADLCSATGGRPYDFRDMTLLPKILEGELGVAVRQVVSDVQVTVKTVRDVKLVSATRVYPSLADLEPTQMPLHLGSLEAGDQTVFILELDVPARPAVRARLAQVGATYLVPAQGYRGEVPPVDLVVEFTSEEALAATVDSEVMGYVQQRNVDHLVRQAASQAEHNPQQAARTLQVARGMTQRLGNRGMTVALGRAEEELRNNGTISAGTRKTIKVGARTQTMKVDGPDGTPQNVPSQEEIRRLTGA